MANERGWLSGDWWAGWQSSPDADEVVMQSVGIAHEDRDAKWWSGQRHRPVAEGGYLWRGNLRLSDEVLMGWYIAEDARVRNKGTVVLRLHPDRRLIVGRWTGLTSIDALQGGWCVLARDEIDCRRTICTLIPDDRPWRWLHVKG